MTLIFGEKIGLMMDSLRWQVYPYLTGYNYKNSIANGCFFNIGARLARYTNNETYAQYAEETWNWVKSVGYMDKDYNIYDGAHIEENCTDINKVQFSYNSGVYLLGAATMYNHVRSYFPPFRSLMPSNFYTNMGVDKWLRNLERTCRWTS